MSQHSLRMRFVFGTRSWFSAWPNPASRHRNFLVKKQPSCWLVLVPDHRFHDGASSGSFWGQRSRCRYCRALVVLTRFYSQLLTVVGIGTLAWSAQPSLLRLFRDRYTWFEPELPTLLKVAQKFSTKRNVRSLDEFRSLLSNGVLEVWAARPDGRRRRLAQEESGVFGTDGWRALIVVKDWSKWQDVRGRPLPKGAIWVRIGIWRARSQRSSKLLIDDTDEDRFAARRNWISATALKLLIRSDALLNNLEILAGLRDPQLRGLSPEKARHKLSELGKRTASTSAIQKLRSGHDQGFEEALEKLPFQAMP